MWWLCLLLSSSVLKVIAESTLSPENTFDRETPPSASNPWPSDCLASISAASFGRLDVRTLRVSLSYQRNAGMLWLLPCRMPAWLAPVCDDRSHSQRVIRWEPLRTHRASVGALPLAIAWRSTGSASPSIWMKITPGTSVGVAAPTGSPCGGRSGAARRRRRRPTARCSQRCR